MATAPVSPTTITYTRQGNGQLELPYEKPVIVPRPDEDDARVHAWAVMRKDVVAVNINFLLSAT